MIACDQYVAPLLLRTCSGLRVRSCSCDEWYHTSCVGMAEADALLIDLYVCAACEASEWSRALSRPASMR